MTILLLLGGLALLVLGAEILVRGASRIATALGTTPLVIGLTIVAFGTSSPELAVSIMSAINGNSDIALGNVVGSNIFNVLFILGISSIIVPLVVAQQLIRLDVPIMIGAALLVLLFALDGRLQVWEGAILLSLGIYYTVFLIRQSKKEKSKKVIKEYEEEFGDEPIPAKGNIWWSVMYIVAGLVLLVLGSRWLVDAAVQIAKMLGVSDLIIGLTIIAAGTSLPEVATSIIASIRGERDIAVGNVVGSNIFNLLIILGVAAIASGKGISIHESALHFDLPVMTAVAIACMPIFFTGRRLDRWEGFVFFGYYVAYTAYLILASRQDATLPTFTRAMAWFVIPLTILTLGILVARELRKQRA
jgi:cation:H+ antiporter